MNRLTFKKPDGTWGIKKSGNEDEKELAYKISNKLLDYEETGLNPDDIEMLKEDAVSVIIEKLKEQRDSIKSQIDADDADLFNRLNLMRMVANFDNAIKLMESWDVNG